MTDQVPVDAGSAAAGYDGGDISSTATGSEAPSIGQNPAAPPDTPAPPAPATPDKFEGKSREDILEMYRNLEQKLGQPSGKEGSPENQPSDGEKPFEGDLSIKPAEAPEGGFVVDQLMAKWGPQVQDGEFPPEALKEFGKAGVSPEVVQQMHQASVSYAKSQAQQVVDSVGGNETYQAMQEWASKPGNLSPQEIAAYEAAVGGEGSFDLQKATMAAAWLQQKFQAAGGGTPQRAGHNVTESGVTPFRSSGEMIAAQNDPRYYHDPSFAAQVNARVAATDPRVLGEDIY